VPLLSTYGPVTDAERPTLILYVLFTPERREAQAPGDGQPAQSGEELPAIQARSSHALSHPFVDCSKYRMTPVNSNGP